MSNVSDRTQTGQGEYPYHMSMIGPKLVRVSTHVISVIGPKLVKVSTHITCQ